MRSRLCCLAAAALALTACGVAPTTPGAPSVAPSLPSATRGGATPAPSVRPGPTASIAATPFPTPMTTPPPGTLSRFDRAELTDGNQLLTLQFVGGRVFAVNNPCSRAYAGWAEQVGDTLMAAVVDVTPPWSTGGGTPIACDAVGYGRSVWVRLPAPFTGSRLQDMAGYLHFLRAPDGLVELRGLPAGWALRSSGDVEESPTGRWQRIYSPQANPPSGTSLSRIELYQAFDGPAGVSGGNEQRTVTVNGRDATLYRDAPTGELVLVWTLGSDGLALVVNEADFSVEELIRLAESAAPG